MSESDDEWKLRLMLVLVLGATMIGGTIDLIMDAPESWWSLHVIFEVGLLVFAMGTSTALWRGWHRTRDSLTATRTMLAARATERDAWRANAESALAGLSQAVDHQLEPITEADPRPQGAHSQGTRGTHADFFQLP